MVSILSNKRNTILAYWFVPKDLVAGNLSPSDFTALSEIAFVRTDITYMRLFVSLEISIRATIPITIRTPPYCTQDHLHEREKLYVRLLWYSLLDSHPNPESSITVESFPSHH